MNRGEALAKVLHYYGLLEGDSDFKIICPFHEDINASMQISISSDEGYFYCHGCHKSGDALQFVIYANKEMDDLQACLEMYRIFRSKKTKSIKVHRRAKIKPDDKQALIEAHDYYYGLRTVDWESDDSDVKSYMLKRGFTPESLNICKAKLTYNDSYPIIFPLLDLGEFRGWVCRTTNKRIEAKRKYLYNKGFSRRNTLVGNYNSKVAVMVEGYMDYLKMRQLGVKNVFAILGWKLTEQQITKLKKAGVETIISALDNDTCGMKGTAYARKFFNVIRFQFPYGVKDPGDLTKEAFADANRKAKLEYRRKFKWVS